VRSLLTKLADDCYFERIIDALVYELYLTDELRAADNYFFRPPAAERLPSLQDNEGDECRSIQKVFERLSARDHEIRRNLYSLSEVESVRIIEGKV